MVRLFGFRKEARLRVLSAARKPIVFGMGYQTTAKATNEQRKDVLRLRKQGRSIRAIAAEVFGDVRYRGRVERILAAGEGVLASLGVEPASLEGLEPMEAIRLLYERRLATLLAQDAPPSMTELQRLLEVQRRLDAYAQVELLRDLTREPRSEG